MSNVLFKPKPTVDEPETGIVGRKKLAGNLSALLADTTLLFVKTQAVHWNVVGPLFFGLHNLTEEQYRNLFEAIDAIAERIRALGYPAPASVAEMIPLSVISESEAALSAEDMIQALADDHEKISIRLRDIIEHAEQQRDAVTADLLTARLQFHEEAVWMLRAILTR
jgi:starvation-inducible DNA-binding protein